MDVGLFAPLVGPHTGPDYVAALGQGAEERHYRAVWLGEHVVLFDDYRSRYPYRPDGRMPSVGPDEGLLEPLTTLAFLASATTSLGLGTGLVILPQRNPVVLAKELSNVDWLSKGRLRIGIGLGWLREEYQALGVPWQGRAARCDDYVEVMRRLWADDVSQLSSPSFELPPARMFPKPVQRPHPPIIVGGDSDAALRRVAAVGDGWYAFAMTPAALEERLARLDELLAEVGRDRRGLHVVLCPYLLHTTPDDVEAYRELGVTELVHTLFARDADELERRFDVLADRGLAPASG